MSAITTTNGGHATEITVFDDAMLGMEGYVIEGQLPIQRVILVQSTKQVKDHPGATQGQWFDEATGEPLTSFAATIMMVRSSRQWSEKFDPGRDEQVIYCRSRDGRVPEPGQYAQARAHEMGCTPEAVRCDACPHSQWRDSDDGGRTVDCGKALAVTVMMPDGTPRALFFKRTSFPLIDTYLKSLIASKKHPSSLTTQIGLKLETKGSNSYYVPVLVKGDPNPVAFQAEIKDWITTVGRLYMDRAIAHDEDAVRMDSGYTGGPTVEVAPSAQRTTTPPPAKKPDLF